LKAPVAVAAPARGGERRPSGLRWPSEQTRRFRLSEINWGIPLAKLVSKTVSDTIGYLKRRIDLMTGRTSMDGVLRFAKKRFKRFRDSWGAKNEDYLCAELDRAIHRDPEKGRQQGLKQFLDEKTFKPGLGTYKR
jgi:feruloyl-CoA hydratase/lyase